jgi:hypothetical protein
MRIRALSMISFALAAGVLFSPGVAWARAAAAQASSGNAVPSQAESLAAQMVPAQAVLDKDLDARKTQPGQEFRATLTSKVDLKNGTELPRGTELVGKIATDSMGNGGKSTLALRFTQAQLKDGKTIPIRATIVGVAAPATSDSWDHSDTEAPPDLWNGKSLQVDDEGVLSGVDLHSQIAGENSGVFVSTKKSDMKLAARSQISLAIAAQGGNMSGGE